MQHCLKNFFQRPDLQLKGSTRSIVQFEGVLPEVSPGVIYASVNFDEQAGVVVGIASELYLADCYDAECGLRQVWSYAEHTVTITTIFLRCSDDCKTSVASSAYSIANSEVSGDKYPAVATPAPPTLFSFRGTPWRPRRLFPLRNASRAPLSPSRRRC